MIEATDIPHNSPEWDFKKKKQKKLALVLPNQTTASTPLCWPVLRNRPLRPSSVVWKEKSKAACGADGSDRGQGQQ